MEIKSWKNLVGKTISINRDEELLNVEDCLALNNDIWLICDDGIMVNTSRITKLSIVC